MTGADTSWIARLLSFKRDGDTFVVAQLQAGPGPRLFGGLIASQALGAAGATVNTDKHPQSLHLYFVRGGHDGVDVEYHVERTRDGGSFDTRRVTATQHGEVILEMITSFHRPEPRADHHPTSPATVEFDDAVPKRPTIEFADRFEIRTRPEDTSAFPVPPFWIRTRDQIEDEPLIQACMLAFMSDFGPVPVAARRVWFHRAFTPHQWHRYEMRSLNNSDSRGLVNGALYDAAGSLIASTSQEALWRI